MCPHLPFWEGTSAQDDLNSWPLPRPKLLQVVVIKIRPGAVQETILMTTRLQEGVSAAHLAECGPARRLRAPWLLVHRSKEWFSHRSESSSMLWGTFLSLLENVTESWAVELWHQWRRRWCSFPQGLCWDGSQALRQTFWPGSLLTHPPKGWASALGFLNHSFW